MTDNNLSTTVNNDDYERFERYKTDKGLNQSQAVRKLIQNGLSEYESVYDPETSMFRYLSGTSLLAAFLIQLVYSFLEMGSITVVLALWLVAISVFSTYLAILWNRGYLNPFSESEPASS